LNGIAEALINLARMIITASAAAAVHEAAHIAVSKAYGLRFKKVGFVLAGQVARIERMEFLDGGKKIAILLSGPLCNFALWGVLQALGAKGVFKDYNLAIGFINMLPCAPLDGGKIAQIILGKKFGVLEGNRIIIKMGKFVITLIFIAGAAQAALFPFNISLILLGIYLAKSVAGERVAMTAEFFKIALCKQERLNERSIRVKSYAASYDTPLKSILRLVSADDYLTIKLIDGGKVDRCVSENEFIDYIFENGVEDDMNVFKRESQKS
jgi:stage IV sporulation protein FB